MTKPNSSSIKKNSTEAKHKSNTLHRNPTTLNK